MQQITIASRGSALALWQANYVKDALKPLGLDARIEVYKTTGDKVQDRFLHEIGGKGLFVKELEQALLDGKADIAVHSMKDLPVKTPEPFKLASILKRHSPYDALIFSKKTAERLSLPDSEVGKEDIRLMGRLKIATGSLRRTSLLREATSSIEVVPLRGNVDTRLRKLEEEDWDAIILAEASLDRLSLGEGLTYRRLSADWFVPSPSQGALVIECKQDSPFLPQLAKMDCAATRKAVTLERAVLERLEGDCTMPFGCFVQTHEREFQGKLKRVQQVDAVVGLPVGKTLRGSLTVPEEYDLGIQGAVDELEKKMLDQGLTRFLEELRQSK